MKSLHIYIVVLSLLICGCTSKTSETTERQSVSVSIPVVGYFVKSIIGDSIDVNVLVPQSVGHSDYSPRPSQMVALSKSNFYLAIGNLDFELTWKNRLCDANKNMKWVDLSQGVTLCFDGHTQMSDPHYWMSPRQLKIMVNNIFDVLKNIKNNSQIVANYENLYRRIDYYDKQLDSLAQSASESISFMIYHPALTYLARDYGFCQLEIEHDGNSPSMQTYVNEIEKSRANNVRVVFVQSGFDKQKAESAAEMIGAQIVEISPESSNWDLTMQTIINSLKQ